MFGMLVGTLTVANKGAAEPTKAARRYAEIDKRVDQEQKKVGHAGRQTQGVPHGVSHGARMQTGLLTGRQAGSRVHDSGSWGLGGGRFGFTCRLSSFSSVCRCFVG